MAGVNKVILLVANFSLATSETRVNRKTNEKTTYTEWHNIAVWGGQADVVEKYLKKGSQIYLEGKLRTRSWDGNDGTKRYTTEVVVDNFTMLGRPNGADGSAESMPPTHEKPAADAKNRVAETNVDDDLPF